MTTTLDTVSIVGLRATHFEQLYQYIEDSEIEGSYYGNKKQYYKRQKELKEWLNRIIKLAKDTNYRIPKKED